MRFAGRGGYAAAARPDRAGRHLAGMHQSAASPEPAALRWNATSTRGRGHPGLDTFIEGALGSQAWRRSCRHCAASALVRAALQVGQLFPALTVAQNLDRLQHLGGEAPAGVRRPRPGRAHWLALRGSWSLARAPRCSPAPARPRRNAAAGRRCSSARPARNPLATQEGRARPRPAEQARLERAFAAGGRRAGFPRPAMRHASYRAQALSRLGRPETRCRRRRRRWRSPANITHLEPRAARHGDDRARARAAGAPARPQRAQRCTGFDSPSMPRRARGAPHEWHAEMSRDLEAAGDLGRPRAAATATAALDQGANAGRGVATGMQVRHRIRRRGRSRAPRALRRPAGTARARCRRAT